MEAVALQHLFDTAVEAFGHAVGLRMLWWGQMVFDAEVGEFLPVVSQDCPDLNWASPFQITQKSAGIGGGPGFEDPSRVARSIATNR
jgi:hypothetical protein